MSVPHENDFVQSMPELSAFWQTVAIRETLARCCKFKQQGVAVFTIFCTLFNLVFRQRNFWRWAATSKDDLPFAKDTAYRFLNSPYHNWRSFLTRLAQKTIAFIATLTSKEKRRVFVVDDSLYNKNRSKKLELLSKVYDHVEDRFVRGFRLLTLAFTDGVSLVPLDFALLGTKKIICEANSAIDGRTHGAKRRTEAISGAPKALLSMIDNHYKLIQAESYIVFDSWFCFPSLIRELVGRKLHVTGRLKKNDTRYLFRRNEKDVLVTLEQLYTKLKRIPAAVRGRKRGANADIMGSFCVELARDEDGEKVPVRIVFLQNKSSGKPEDWLAILTTDIELSEEDVVRMYAKRWKIEEFFKVTKSLLGLEREFQGRSYDMLIAHTTLVFVRYMFLELERRRNVDIRTCGELFYRCCDEIPDLKVKEAVLKIFQVLEVFLREFSPNGKEALKACIEYFTATLPAPLLKLMPLSGCES